MDLFGVFETNANADGIQVENQVEDEVSMNVEAQEKVEAFKIIKNQENEGCIHEWYTPEDYQPILEKKQNAKQYKFTLDPFQKVAVKTLESNESVLVAAHTSAGKTAVAEYAIAMAKRDKQRVVYTSPIKALSNQKYRELQQEFGDVGLVTGDVTLNENAFCLVMTTEILRSMLYRGSEIVREVAWVIMDEVHYMRDRERGVVWEETIILLNQNVRFVFLSATIPNASEFAEWVCRIKRQPCHVVYTDYRPTPLQHYLFPSGAEGIYLVVDETGKFKEDKFQEAVAKLEENVENTRKRKATEGSDLFKLMKMIQERELAPAIVFSFSKREVEGYAIGMQKLDLTTPKEKENIETIYKNAMNCLSEEDRQLPQIQLMLPILKKGIGIHHGGLLPIVKEIIEILFQEGYLKALFSTETFSMGLNMPSRTVVFTSVRKFDGEQFRWIQGGEYIQMSGRAGRRGIDDKGVCILMCDEKMDQEVAKSMLKGKSDGLNSSFRLSYNMLINSMRMEDTDPEFIIKKSFHQFQNDRQLPEMKEKLQDFKQKRDQIQIENEDKLGNYHDLISQSTHIYNKIKKIIYQPQIVLPFMHIGRIIRIKGSDGDWGWGIQINFMQKKFGNKKNKDQEQSIILDVMLYVQKRKKNEPLQPQLSYEQDGELEIVPVSIEQLYEISTIKLNLPKDLRTNESKQQIKQTMIKLLKEFKGQPPLIHPIKDMKINDDQLDKLLEQRQSLIEQIEQVKKDLNNQNLEQELKVYDEKIKLGQTIKLLNKQIDESSQMVLSGDLKRMKRILRRLQYISKDEIVQMKGKVACEISAGDEIMLTELLVSGLFNDLASEEICAVLSVFVHDENNSEKFQLKNDKMQQLYTKVLEQAKYLYTVYTESKMNIDEKEYLATFKSQMMEVTLAWCQGQSFLQICKMTDLFEGSIIRCLRRLDELIKQMEEAAKVIGNKELENKFKESSKKLKKGIVFAASLYL
ncbi:unnamed protein product [Paramecium primaurelia]|uniref:Uncharacterized protein n=1 Tax=Paramecium primaurelia TaxID=5886 RepID=A0A8S1Q3D4_PARPR|nr:unnamed protein product [Paramecium primaurelia]